MQQTTLPQQELTVLQPAQLQELKDYCAVVSDRTGVSIGYATLVGSSLHGANIRAAMQQDKHKAILSLSLEIEHCATTYCGSTKTDDTVFDEAVQFVFLRFAHLGIAEIREAFRLAAAKEIDVDLSAYFGLFTVKMLGDLLWAYNQYRNRLAAHFLSVERENDAVRIATEKQARWNLNEWVPRRLETLRGLEDPQWRHCTAFDHDKLLEAGAIQYTIDDKRRAWTDAHFFVFQEMSALALRSIGFRRQLEEVQRGVFTDDYRAKRTVIAQQLLVFRCLFPHLDETTDPEKIQSLTI